jgi:hypothetical protein
VLKYRPQVESAIAKLQKYDDDPKAKEFIQKGQAIIVRIESELGAIIAGMTHEILNAKFLIISIAFPNLRSLQRNQTPTLISVTNDLHPAELNCFPGKEIARLSAPGLSSARWLIDALERKNVSDALSNQEKVNASLGELARYSKYDEAKKVIDGTSKIVLIKTTLKVLYFFG